MSIEIKKFNKLFRELQYQQSELDYVLEILKKAHWDFEEYYRVYCKDKEIDIDSLNEKHKKRVQKIIPNRKQQHDKSGNLITTDKVQFIDNTDMKEMKRIYREIVKIIHPDKGGDEATFKKVAKAMKDKNWEILLDTCQKHDILLDDYKKLNKILLKRIDEIKEKIKQEKSSYSWNLYQCEDNEKCKNNVVKKFLKHLFDYGDYK